MSVSLGPQGAVKNFNVRVARQRSLLATLVFTALTNSVDMEGDLPEEMTADLTARIELEGLSPIVLKDTFSGFSGGRAPTALYGQVATVVQLLTYNPHKPIRITRIDCETQVQPGRHSADIEAMELESETYAPGETVKGTVFVRPYKGLPERVPVSLKLPADLPEGNYTVTACDDLYNARATIRNNPNLSSPQSVEQVLEALQVQMSAKRTNVVLRLPVEASGVAVDGKTLPDLPASMVHILGNSRRTGAQTLSSALVSRKGTRWVVQGNESVHISVCKHHHQTRAEEP
jgi:hypothetical protein